MIDETKKYRYRNGEKPWKIITGIPTSEGTPVLSIKENGIILWHDADGLGSIYAEHSYDLIEIQPFEDFKDGDPVMVREGDSGRWTPRYFKEIRNGKAVCYECGATKWTSNGVSVEWPQCRRPTPEELGEG